MSIVFISKSFEEHETVDGMTITTAYSMTWRDMYNHSGTLLTRDGGNVLRPLFRLPYMGDSFSLYYNTSYFSDNIVLVDRTMTATDAVANPFDGSGEDLDKQVIVNYSWSNSGASDTRRSDEASSWNIWWETSLENSTVNNYIEWDTGDKKEWASVYLEAKNPDVEATGEKYNDLTNEQKQQYKIDFYDDIPELSRTEPKAILFIRAYSAGVKTRKYSSLLNSVNSIDFIQSIYLQKELALNTKKKTPSYLYNDWLDSAQDDSGLLKFINFEINDIGNGFYENILSFEFNIFGWNKYKDNEVDINVNQYRTIDFYESLISGMDLAKRNARVGR